MKRIIIALLAALHLLLAASALAQAPDTMWTRTFGGDWADAGSSVRQTADGGFIVSGFTTDFPQQEVWLIKTDSNGDSLWAHTFGDGYSYSVDQTTDGGYIMTGMVDFGSDGSAEVFLIKSDSAGSEEWYQTFGGTESEFGYSVQQTNDGGYIIAGTTESFGAGDHDVWLIKTDADGDSMWTRTFGGTEGDTGSCVQQTMDGGYIIAGSTRSYGAGMNDVWLIKTDAAGDSIWTRTFGGIEDDIGSSVQQTDDGGYIIGGATHSYGIGCSDVWLIKTNAEGDSLWSRTYGTVLCDRGSCVEQTSDEGYIITGQWGQGAPPNWGELVVLRTDVAGNELWNIASLGGGHGLCAQQTADGGYIIAGYHGAWWGDVWLIRFGTETSADDEPFANCPSEFVLYPSYPNPFNSSAAIRYSLPIPSKVIIDIYDLLGRKIETLIQAEQPAGYHQVVWDASDYPSGLYFYRISAGDYIETKKMVLLK